MYSRITSARCAAPYQGCLLLAAEAAGRLDAAAALVARDLGPRAQGTRAIRGPGGGQVGVDAAGVARTARGGDDRLGRRAVLDPLHQRSEHVELVGGRAAGAVAHARHLVVAREVQRGAAAVGGQVAVPVE